MYWDVCVYFVLWTHPSDSLCCINGTCGSRFAMVQLPLFVCWNIKGVVLGFSVMALPSLGLLLYTLCKRFLFVFCFFLSRATFDHPVSVLYLTLCQKLRSFLSYLQIAPNGSFSYQTQCYPLDGLIEAVLENIFQRRSCVL